ncbi:MAG TPA: nucleoside transporter C-terminal domain-containing protein [Opitutaceae bacterium]|nr:nucleoside transporter C-terminal domain-containing protein [Opitutaceae bacterium]
MSFLVAHRDATSFFMETFSHVWRGLLGIVGFIGIAYLCSENRRAIPWRLVGAGLILQIACGVLVLRVDAVRQGVDWVGNLFVSILDFNRAGSEFLFGSLIADTKSFGYIFAFNVLPTIVFFSALTSLLFYLGILQRIVFGFAWLMSKTMKLSGAESLSASANIFLGQTEAPLLIKPYLATMTRSEMLAVMVGGMANIAGAVLVAYIGMLGGEDPVQRLLFAKHLITASIMSAPASLYIAKILIPQTEEVDESIVVPKDKIGANALEAVANGTTDGVKLAVNVGAMLLVFTAFIAMFNAILSSGVGSWTGLNAWITDHTAGRYTELSMQYILGILFAPLAWLMGVDSGSLTLAGQVIGEKTILNEFYAYGTLGKLISSGQLPDLRAQVILTYALCGFANVASIGILIGGIGTLAPNQRPMLARLGVKALIGGSLCCFLGASIAGILVR